MASVDSLSDLIPGLPEEIGLECLTQFHYSTHPIASGVCRRWQKLLQSREFYHRRKRTGYTHKVACLVQLLKSGNYPDGSKQVCPPRYGITVFDPVRGTWDRVDPFPKHPDRLPLFCQRTSSEGKLVVMGRWDPTSYDPVKDVFVYKFTSQRWRQRKQMPETRSFFAAGELGGRVIVAGGHDENKNALSKAWEYNVNRDKWTKLTQMSQKRDECQGIVMGSKFWVVSRYRTENQGGFEKSVEVINVETGKWSRVEAAWKASQSPRSCVGVGKEKKLFSWTNRDPAVRVAECTVPLGEWTFVCGSAYQGGPQGFFLVNEQKGKFRTKRLASRARSPRAQFNWVYLV
ncbi:hypothetical protein DITRI_Ditri12bG0120300 [Diplodiscus trichospermus]